MGHELELFLNISLAFSHFVEFFLVCIFLLFNQNLKLVDLKCKLFNFVLTYVDVFSKVLLISVELLDLVLLGLVAAFEELSELI